MQDTYAPVAKIIRRLLVRLVSLSFPTPLTREAFSAEDIATYSYRISEHLHM